MEKTIPRWVLVHPHFGLYAQYPERAEKLFTSKREAIAHALSGGHYGFVPIRVELRVFSHSGEKELVED